MGSPFGPGVSQRCIGSMSAAPAVSASEVPRKPRRLSIRSLREYSLIACTVCCGLHGRSTPPPTVVTGTAARRPRSSIDTTEPKRSENSSDMIFGMGSRGCSPSSHRRTREVSVETWCAPICRALRFTWRASSPFDQPLRANQEPSFSFGCFSPMGPSPSRPGSGLPFALTRHFADRVTGPLHSVSRT